MIREHSEDSDPGIRPVWSESSQCAQWIAKDLTFLHADSEDWLDWAAHLSSAFSENVFDFSIPHFLKRTIDDIKLASN